MEENTKVVSGQKERIGEICIADEVVAPAGGFERDDRNRDEGKKRDIVRYDHRCEERQHHEREADEPLLPFPSDDGLGDARQDAAFAKASNGCHEAEQQDDDAPVDVARRLRYVTSCSHRHAGTNKGDAKHRLVSQKCDYPIEHRFIVALEISFGRFRIGAIKTSASRVLVAIVVRRQSRLHELLHKVEMKMPKN